MTPQLAAGLCSLMGAIFFFCAGFFFARHKMAFDQGKYEREIQAAKEREESVREKAIQDNLSFKRNIDMQKQKKEAYQKATQKRISELKEQVVRLNSILGDYKERLNDLAIEITRADSEKVLLTEALEVTKKDLKEIAILEKENEELTNQLNFLNNQIKESERLRVENQDLMAKLSQLESSEENVNALNMDKTPPSLTDTGQSQSVARLADATSQEGLGKAFQTIVNQISQLDGSRGVVVADELGLLIAGIGDHMDRMAGMAAIFSEINTRVSALIPFGNIGSIRIKNMEDMHISMQPFSMDSEKVILAIYATGDGPDQDTITQLTQQAIAI